MKCPRCFNEITDSSTICPNCGLELFAQNVDANNLDKEIKRTKNAINFLKDLPGCIYDFFFVDHPVIKWILIIGILLFAWHNYLMIYG